MTAAAAWFPEGTYDDGYDIYTGAQGKMTSHIQVKLHEKVLLSQKTEIMNPIKMWISLLGKW